VLRQALARADGNVSGAARLLGIGRAVLPPDGARGPLAAPPIRDHGLLVASEAGFGLLLALPAGVSRAFAVQPLAMQKVQLQWGRTNCRIAPSRVMA
jgi:hypothetical protein